jgi:hypothetical protein
MKGLLTRPEWFSALACAVGMGERGCIEKLTYSVFP